MTKRFASIATMLLLLAGCNKSAPSDGPQEPVTTSTTPTVDPEAEKEASVARCDQLASHPSDNKRMAAAVSDAQVAPGQAIPACEDAAKRDPDNARIQFELGRVYLVGGRESEAFDSLSIAAGAAYPIAMKFIGDAYLERRGLPDSEKSLTDDDTYQRARAWYQKSADAGFSEGSKAFAEVDDLIAKNTFDPSGFQNPNAMRAVYENRILEGDAPVLNAYYAKGIVEQMDSNDQFFIKPECKPLIYKITGLVTDIQVLVSYASGLKSGKDFGVAVLSYAVSGFAEDMGKRDAINLMNKYGCDSRITKTVIDNIALTNSSHQ